MTKGQQLETEKIHIMPSPEVMCIADILEKGLFSFSLPLAMHISALCNQLYLI